MGTGIKEIELSEFELLKIEGINRVPVDCLKYWDGTHRYTMLPEFNFELFKISDGVYNFICKNNWQNGIIIKTLYELSQIFYLLTRQQIKKCDNTTLKRKIDFITKENKKHKKPCQSII